MSDVISQSRASLLVKGFENAAPLGLPKHGPALSPSVFISAISGSTLSCQLVWFVVQIILLPMILSIFYLLGP